MPKKSKLKGQSLWTKAKKIIPGGTQLLSKRAELFLPDQWPAYFKKAKGCEVEDLDGNKYIDMYSMGIGACILGYADPDVNKAVKKVVDQGSMCTLNSPEEVELAELLLKLHPWAEQVRYARTGGEAMAQAVRIARAASGKDQVAFCGYHGWHDWYLAANLANDKNLDGQLMPGLEPRGVPRGLLGTSIPFHYNKIDELEKIVAENDIGVIVLEAVRHQEPKNNFLEKVREIADKKNIVLVFDEVSSGFRFLPGGAHLKYKVYPDISVFAKGMSNGYPMAAIIGKKKFMESAQETFISSTYWTERTGPAAAIATIKKMINKKVHKKIEATGSYLIKNLRKIIEKNGLKMEVAGLPALIHFSFDYGKENNLALATLFSQEMLKEGIIAASGIYVSFAFEKKYVKRYLESFDKVSKILKKAADSNKIKDYLEGPVAHAGFTRLT